MKRYDAMLGCFLLSLFFPLILQASAIQAYPLEVNLDAQHRFQNIKVYNTGRDTAYVQLNIARVENPGLPSQQLLPLTNNPYEVGFIVTPNKMVIPVHQMRIARALYIGDLPQNNDVVYKLRIAPVTGQLIAMGSNNNINAAVNVIVAYSINVFVRPLHPQPHLVLSRDHTQLTIQNMGNTNVLLGTCQQCQNKNKDCKKFSLSKRVYVGQTIHYPLPEDLPVSCEQIFEEQKIVNLISN